MGGSLASLHNGESLPSKAYQHPPVPFSRDGWGYFTERDRWMECSYPPQSTESCFKEQSSLAKFGLPGNPVLGAINSLTVSLSRRTSQRPALHQYPKVLSSQCNQVHTHKAPQEKCLPCSPMGTDLQGSIACTFCILL